VSPSGSGAAACVHSIFEEQVRRTPDAVAVRYDDQSATYGQLNDWANEIARRLANRGVTVGDRVGLYAARSGACIAAMLAILKAGAAYVPLEASLPAQRLRLMAGAAPRLILCVPPLRWDLSATPTLTLEDCAGPPPRGSAPPGSSVPGNPGLPVSPDDLLYIPYTSGSTGAPKGVEVAHRSVRGLFADGELGPWGPGTTVLHHAALSWDAHIVEIYPALLSGGCVWVYPGDSRDPAGVVSFARHHRIGVLGLPTQAFNTVVSTNPAAFDWLPRLLIGGESAQSDQLAATLERTPELQITNVYGPVECTGLATARQVRPADLRLPSIPIGHQVGDRQVYVLDAAGEPVADGEAGEAYIGGPAVARGYLGQSGLTASRFVPDPLSGVPGARLYRTGDLVRRDAAGVFHFLGREDDQVKLRGFRIELGEVDAALRSHPAVADAATVVVGTGDVAYLAAYVTATGAAPLDGTAVRDHVRQTLTPAMVPAVIVPVSAFPTTDSGKLDRRALPAPPEPGPAPGQAEPRTVTEQRIADAWHRVLGIPRPGRDADFFASGGNSLAATRIVLQLREVSRADIQIRHLYEAPVLAELAALVDRLEAGARAALPPIRARAADASRGAPEAASGAALGVRR
jgi:amino acid adenylation domain-containing protein